MDHGAHAGRMFFHDLHSVRGRFPAVNDHGHVLLPGDLKLTDEPALLYIMSGLVPIVIQADLARRHDLRKIEQLAHPLHISLRERPGFVRMDADGAVYERILLRQIHDPVPGLQRGAGIYDQADAAFQHPSEQLRPVGVKLLIIIMCMCINYHFPFSPSEHARASGILLFAPRRPVPRASDPHLHRQLDFQNPRPHSGRKPPVSARTAMPMATMITRIESTLPAIYLPFPSSFL